MKKLFTLLLGSLLLWGCSYDDNDIWKSIKDIEDDITDLDERVKALEELVKSINDDIKTLAAVVDAVDNQLFITEITETENEYIFTINDETRYTVIKGSSSGGSSPVISMVKEGGVYYWTILSNGTWDYVYENGQKLAVGLHYSAPTISIDDEGYWIVNYGGEDTYIYNKDGDKIKGEVVDSPIETIEYDDKSVTFTLPDGTLLTIARAVEGGIEVEDYDWDFGFYQVKTFRVNVVGVAYSENREFIVVKPNGWSANITETAGELTLVIISPRKEDIYAEISGPLSILMIQDGITLVKKLHVSAYDNTVVNFANIDAKYLAGPTYKAENLYSSYEGEQFTSYTDPDTGLVFGIREDYGTVEYWNGGFAISNWRDIGISDYTNQVSVYDKSQSLNIDHSRFAVGYGSASEDDPISIHFEDPTTERWIESFYVANTEYAYYTMKNGNDYAKALSYEDEDYFYVTISGYDASNTHTGDIVVKLADFTSPSATGIIEGFKKVRLTGLGKVNKLTFTFSGSDIGDYGLNTPAYVCISNIVVAN